MLIFLVLSFVAAYACFHVGKHRLMTPLGFNLLGSFSVWAAVFSLGAALAGSGPWSPGPGEPAYRTPYTTAATFFCFAALNYGGALLLQRAIANRRRAKSGSGTGPTKG